MTAKKVVVFIPAYNEEDRIADTIRAVRHVYPIDVRNDEYNVDIIVIDDGSLDGTAKKAADEGVRVIYHPRNLGLGAATRTGMRTAYEMGADISLKLDADLQHDPADIDKVIRPILDDKADIVYGSRFMGEIKYKMPFVRYVGNRFFTWLMRVLTKWDISDAQTGLMVYSKRYLAVFNMPGNYNPPHQTLIDAYHKHMRYAEVPVVFHARVTGKSFISFKYPFNFISQVFRTLVMVNPMKVFVPLSFIFFAAAFIWGGTEFYLKHFKGVPLELHYICHLILFICGIQIFFFGILADLICNRK